MIGKTYALVSAQPDNDVFTPGETYVPVTLKIGQSAFFAKGTADLSFSGIQTSRVVNTSLVGKHLFVQTRNTLYEFKEAE